MSKFKSHLLRPKYDDGSTGLEGAWDIEEAKQTSFLKKKIKPKLFEPEYMVREIGPNTYEVTKWTHGASPTGIYTVRAFKKWTCDCPARGKCRHMDIVREWLKKNKPKHKKVVKRPYAQAKGRA